MEGARMIIGTFWSLQLEFRCKIQVHTSGLVLEASPCDKSASVSSVRRPLGSSNLKLSNFPLITYHGKRGFPYLANDAQSKLRIKHI